MDRDEVKVHKLAKTEKERGQYPAILTEQTWSIKDLLYGFSRGVSQIAYVAFFTNLVVAAKSSFENQKKNTSIHSNITANKGLYFLFTFIKSHIYAAMSYREVTPLIREQNNVV